MNTNLVRASYCVLLALASLVAKAQPVPDFSATPLNGCAPLHVNFTDLSSGNITQWKWDLGNGTISYLKNPSVTYLVPGSYTIKLVVENAQGKDSVVRTAYINVYGLPEVNFSSTTNTGCAPSTIRFTDLTGSGNGNNVQWEWDFGDGNVSGLQNPEHTYTSPGTYNVSLRVTNVHGCIQSITRQQFITITPPVNALFSWVVPQGCNISNTISFQNQSTGSGQLSYFWDFGDGNTSTDADPVHAFPAAGNYNVQLSVITAAGCTSVYQFPGGINIGSTMAIIGSPDSVCLNSPVQFSNNSIPAAISSQWDFGDGSFANTPNPVKTFSTPGNYTIQLISDFGGCFDTTTTFITVTAPPVAAFQPSVTASCTAPLSVTFSNTSTGAANYQWNFGDGETSVDQNPVHTFTSPGNYTVSLIVFTASGCSDTLVMPNAIVISRPEALISFNPFEGCAPLQVQLNSTVNTISPVVNYHWDLGDGTISNEQNPVNIYQPGVYDISLIINTADGCTDTVVMPQAIRAGIKPEAAFSANPRRSCAFAPIQFTDHTIGNPDRWLWDFGDGGTSTSQNPQHVYGDTGYFTIRLITWNNGCADTVEIENYIYIDPPIARFSTAMSCEEPYKRIFTDESIGAHTWHWNFGDGNTSSQQSPVHTYSSPGTYEAVLTVTNTITGCTFQETEQVWIIDESAAFNTSDTVLCRNEIVTFTGVAAPGNLSSYNWDFGDGNTGFGHSVTHSYIQAGTYTVRLIIIDQHGCADTLVKPYHIRVNGPVAGFGVESPDHCMAANVAFSDSSFSDGIHEIVSWTWNFGDGTTITQPSGPFSHSYMAQGIYSVSLTVIDNSGCSDIFSLPNVINISKPEAAFESDTIVCLGNSVAFHNNSQAQSPAYFWDFGDGNFSTEVSPQHIYSSTGTYSVQLIVINASGCADTLLLPDYITVNNPIADFAASDTFGTCPPLVVNFENTSSGFISYHWDFGDGTSSNALNPSHFYSVPGIFVARLTINAAGGCTKIKEQTIVVKGPTGSFSYDDLSGCVPHNVNFQATTQNNVSFIWDFNDGNTLATTDSAVSHTFMSTGSYVPKMILKDAGGCTVSIQGADTIKVEGITATAGFNEHLFCGTGNVQFNANISSTSPITDTQWYFGDGTTSTGINPIHEYTSPGEYQPYLVAKNATGCTDTIFLAVPVKIHPKPDAFINPVDPACAPLQTNLNAEIILNTGITTFEWSSGNGSSTSGPTAAVEYPVAGNYTASLVLTDSVGCKDTATTAITVFSIPQVSAGTDQTVCLGIPVQLSATGASTYSWSMNSTLSCSDCATPLANPIQNSTYYVTGISNEGCIGTDSISLSVIQPFNIIASRGDSICAGGSIGLTASGADEFQWFPSTGLNVTSGSSVVASPNQSITYSVIGMDSHGCFRDTVQIPVKVFPVPVVEAGEDVTINAGQTTDLIPQVSEDVTEVTWTPTGSIFRSTYPSITVKPRETTTFRVEVENAGGCRASDQVTVHVICNDANIFIPNTFSPNGDGNNDAFYPRGSGLFTIRSFRIYNRWGELVFERNNMEPNNYSSGWNGTYKGKILSPDVYVYIAEVECENKTIMPLKGNVALIR